MKHQTVSQEYTLADAINVIWLQHALSSSILLLKLENGTYPGQNDVKLVWLQHQSGFFFLYLYLAQFLHKKILLYL